MSQEEFNEKADLVLAFIGGMVAVIFFEMLVAAL